MMPPSSNAVTLANDLTQAASSAVLSMVCKAWMFNALAAQTPIAVVKCPQLMMPTLCAVNRPLQSLGRSPNRPSGARFMQIIQTALVLLMPNPAWAGASTPNTKFAATELLAFSQPNIAAIPLAATNMLALALLVSNLVPLVSGTISINSEKPTCNAPPSSK